MQPRIWSNEELRRFAHLFTGEVVNVSGWRDEDKRGAHYRSYFTKAKAYHITNYPGSRGLEGGSSGGIALDLEQAPPPELLGKFEVVFSHTVLEHIFSSRLALHHLALLSSDVVIVVVPFLQDEHFEEGSYADHWRWAPASLKRSFAEEGFEVLYSSTNDSPFFPIYNFIIASKFPERWRAHFPTIAGPVGARIGAGIFDARISSVPSLT